MQFAERYLQEYACNITSPIVLSSGTEESKDVVPLRTNLGVHHSRTRPKPKVAQKLIGHNVVSLEIVGESAEVVCRYHVGKAAL